MIRFIVCMSLVSVSLATSSPLHAQIDFDIQVNFSGDDSFRSFFVEAEEIWESILPQRIDGQNDAGTTFGTLIIDASVRNIDGRGMILGRAGPTSFANDGNFELATRGLMEFDSSDIDRLAGAGRFADVIVHEMGHVLGFGFDALWRRNDLYSAGSGEYFGENALEQYRIEFDADATSVPVQLDLRRGSDDNHWDEGSQTVIDTTSPNFGRPLSEALMTSNFASSTFISNTTGGQFQDLGFVVDFDAIQGRTTSVPEPSSMVVLAGISLLSLSRRRSV